MAQRVEGGKAGAKERAGIGGIERIGNAREGFDGSDHVLPVAAVEADAAHYFVFAIDEIAFAAGRAVAVMPAVPAHADAVTRFPSRDAGPKFINDASDFMAGNPRVAQAGPMAFLYDAVSHADSAGLDLDANLAGTRRRNFAFDDFKVAPSLRDLSRFHFRHDVLRPQMRQHWMRGRRRSVRTRAAHKCCAFGTSKRKRGLRRRDVASYTGTPSRQGASGWVAC